MVALGNVELHKLVWQTKMKYFHLPSSTRNMRPLLEHGGDYIHHNVPNIVLPNMS